MMGGRGERMGGWVELNCEFCWFWLGAALEYCCAAQSIYGCIARRLWLAGLVGRSIDSVPSI
jgi:hypothetical protein